MGHHVCDWFLPINPTRGDPARFEFNQDLVKKLQARARAIATGQGVEIGNGGGLQRHGHKEELGTGAETQV
jgi:hypothetical protein